MCCTQCPAHHLSSSAPSNFSGHIQKSSASFFLRFRFSTKSGHASKLTLLMPASASSMATVLRQRLRENEGHCSSLMFTPTGCCLRSGTRLTPAQMMTPKPLSMARSSSGSLQWAQTRNRSCRRHGPKWSMTSRPTTSPRYISPILRCRWDMAT